MSDQFVNFAPVTDEAFGTGTHNSQFKTSFNWKIEKFVQRLAEYKPGQYFDSEMFCREGINWVLRCFPYGYLSQSESSLSVDCQGREEEQNLGNHQPNLDHISVFLVRGSGGATVRSCQTVYGVFDLCILDSRQQMFNFSTSYFVSDLKQDFFPGVGFFAFILKNVLFSRPFTLLPGGTLTLSCRLVFQFDTPFTETPQFGEVTGQQSLIHPRENFFGYQEFNSYKLILNNGVLFIDKLLLAENSEKFRNLFLGRFERTEELEATQFDGSIVQEVIACIYSNFIVPDLELWQAEKWLEIINFYDFLHLKVKQDLIEMGLIAILNQENSAYLLLIANQYFCKELKQAIVNFVTKQTQSNPSKCYYLGKYC